MNISLIAAMANNNVIGISSQNKMPWHLPADLKYFREKTLYKTVIMGRKTFESIGKPLPYRRNIVLTNYPDGINPFGSEPVICTTLSFAIKQAKVFSDPEIMIIGGGSVYKQALPIVNRMYITRIHADIEGDVHFPKWEEKDWELVSKEDHLADDKNKFDYSFCVYERL